MSTNQPTPDQAFSCAGTPQCTCVEVNTVYDLCSQVDETSVCSTDFDRWDRDDVTSVACTATCDCTFQSSTPVSTGSDFVYATFLITCTVTFTFTTPTKTCTSTETVSRLKQVVLCAPAGNVLSCDIIGVQCMPPAFTTTQACTTIMTCAIFKSVRLQNLLIQSYGECTPAPCEVSPIFPCPPPTPPYCSTPTA